MLNLDEERFIRIQAGALALAGPLHEAVGTCLAERRENLFFLGSGGAGILMQPAARVADEGDSAAPRSLERHACGDSAPYCLTI